MNVLQIIQSFCYEINIPAPASGLASTTDPAYLQLVYLFYATGRDLRQAKCWPQLKKTYSFTTSNGVATYALPTDFYASLLDTYWDATDKWKMAGPLTDAKYNELFYGYATFSNRIYFRVFGQTSANQFALQPTPGTTNLDLTYDYITKNWILHSATWQETITADTDTVAFDDDMMILGMKWKWFQMKDYDQQESFRQEYMSKINFAQARWAASRKTDLFPTPAFLAGLDPNIPEGSYTL